MKCITQDLKKSNGFAYMNKVDLSIYNHYLIQGRRSRSFYEGKSTFDFEVKNLLIVVNDVFQIKEKANFSDLENKIERLSPIKSLNAIKIRIECSFQLEKYYLH